MGKVRIHQLAERLGVTSAEVMRRLKESGEFVKSASSTVEPVVAQRLLQGCRPSPGRPAHEQTLEEFLGVPDLRRQHQRRGSVASSSTTRAARVRPAQQGDLSVAVGERFNLHRQAADRAALAWASADFEPEEVRRWWDAGLGPYDAPEARQYEAAGLRPQDLQKEILGIAAAKRLRQGETLGSVVARLRGAG